MNDIIITTDNHPLFKKGEFGRFVRDDADGAMIFIRGGTYFCHNSHFKFYNDHRCLICGAKEESHYEDHLCRLHMDNRGICLICRKPFQNCYIKGGLCIGNIKGGCQIDCIANDYF